MNILLLAMSTYPGTMRRFIASCGEGQPEYSCFSQLDPGCKHFISKLAEKGEKFDKIISLCTEETLKAPCEYKDAQGNPRVKRLMFEDEAVEDISELSPYEFFRKRIIGYITGRNAFGYEEARGIDVTADRSCAPFAHPELYPYPESLFGSVKIEDGEVEITSTIMGVIKIIDSLPGDKDKPIQLYLNAQGGPVRGVLQALQAG